jgi:PilZ domain
MRKRKRYPIFASAVIKGKDKRVSAPTETMIAIANISRTGLGLYSYTPIGEGTVVSLDIAFSAHGKKERHDTVRGRVVWETKKGALYFAGVSLDKNLSPSGQPFMYAYLRKIMRKSKDEEDPAARRRLGG